MNQKDIVQKIASAREKASSRKFAQSIDLGVNFSDINLENTEYKLNQLVLLPKGRGKDVEIGIFADGDMNLRAKKLSKHVLNKNELEQYAKNKRKMRTYANQCYAFIASADLMASIGKSWGVVLGPRSKMPQPVPPNADLDGIVKRLKNSVRLRSKKNPTIHIPVGAQDLSDDDVAANIMAVYNELIKKIPKEHIKSIYVKFTMGEAVILW